MTPPGDGRLPSRPGLLAVFFLLGFLATLLQTLFLREIMVVALGNEIVIALVLFHWLGGVFVGSRLGGRLADRDPAPGDRLFQVMLLLALLAPAALAAVRHLHRLTATPPGLSIGMLQLFLASLLLVAPQGCLVGTAFPLAVRGARRGRGMAHMTGVYMLESLGSLVAGALLSWVLAGRWPTFRILFSALAATAAATLTVGCIRRRARLIVPAALALAAAAAGLIPGPSRALEQATIRDRWQGFSSTRLLVSRESRYQNIALGRGGGQYALYLNGQMSEAFPDPERQRLLAARLLSQHPHPRRVLVIGAAVSGLAQALLATDLEALHNVELDRRVVDTVRRFLPGELLEQLADPRFQLHIADGRRYVLERRRNHPRAPLFQLVFINASEPASLLANRYYTREFLEELTGILAPDGVVCLHITASDTYTAGGIGAYAAAILRTLERVFPYAVVSPGPDSFLFASRRAGVVSRSPSLLAARWKRRAPGTPDRTALFSAWFPPERPTPVAPQTGGLNTDDRPLAVHLYNRSLGWVHAGGMQRLLTAAEGLRSIHLLLAAILLLLPAVLLRRGAGSITPAVTVAGFSGMSLQLLILTLVQSRFGFIYGFIGLFTALFMAGLPLGAMLSRRLARRYAARPLLAGFLSLLALQALALKWLLPAAGRHPVPDQIWISMLTVLLGSLVGAVFPAALAAALPLDPRHRGRSTGRVNAADHAGAALGALLAGTLLLPVLGMGGMTRLLAGVNLAAALLLLSRGRGVRARRSAAGERRSG